MLRSITVNYNEHITKVIGIDIIWNVKSLISVRLQRMNLRKKSKLFNNNEQRTVSNNKIELHCRAQIVEKRLIPRMVFSILLNPRNVSKQWIEMRVFR